jgi:hypothetical protein
MRNFFIFLLILAFIAAGGLSALSALAESALSI